MLFVNLNNPSKLCYAPGSESAPFGALPSLHRGSANFDLSMLSQMTHITSRPRARASDELRRVGLLGQVVHEQLVCCRQVGRQPCKVAKLELTLKRMLF